jgi:hypothetical protein
MLTDKLTTSKSEFKIQVKTKDGKSKYLDGVFSNKVDAIKELNNILIGLKNGDRCENIKQLIVLEFSGKFNENKITTFN